MPLQVQYNFTMKTTISFFLAALVLVSCEKKSLTALDTQSQPVISAYLEAGQAPIVKISRQLGYEASDSSAIYILNLDVYIESEGIQYPLKQNSDGYYTATTNWTPQAGKTYRLHFLYDNVEVQAETYIPSAPTGFKASAGSIKIPTFDISSGGSIPDFPDPIKLTWDNTEGDFYQVKVVNIETDPTAINDNSNGNAPPGQSFSNSPEQSDAYELGFQSFSYYGTHQVILYKVNSEYVSLTKSTGTNSQNLTTPYTNVTNGLGIFTGVGADTLIIEVKK
jgi:hypothetical protein